MLFVNKINEGGNMSKLKPITIYEAICELDKGIVIEYIEDFGHDYKNCKKRQDFNILLLETLYLEITGEKEVSNDIDLICNNIVDEIVNYSSEKFGGKLTLEQAIEYIITEKVTKKKPTPTAKKLAWGSLGLGTIFSIGGFGAYTTLTTLVSWIVSPVFLIGAGGYLAYKYLKGKPVKENAINICSFLLYNSEKNNLNKKL